MEGGAHRRAPEAGFGDGEGFGALALEQIIETAEAWEAETIFAGLSPLSETVVAQLERQPLLIHKDVHQAIAAAFQISEAQRSCV